MTPETVRLEARINATKLEIADVDDALALLVEQLAVKQLRIDAWYANTQSRLTRRKARLLIHLAAAKRAKQRDKHRLPAQATRTLLPDLATPTNVKPA